MPCGFAWEGGEGAVLSLMLCSVALAVLERSTTAAIPSTLQHPSCHPIHQDRLFVLIQGIAPEKIPFGNGHNKNLLGFDLSMALIFLPNARVWPFPAAWHSTGKAPAEAGCRADCWSSGLNLEKALVKKRLPEYCCGFSCQDKKKWPIFLAFDWWARHLADKPTPYATLVKKVHIKKKKPETKVTALAKLSVPLMLRYGTGSCLEPAQHSLGSQHSPRGFGWNATPMTISHLIHKRINRHPYPLHTLVPTHFKSSVGFSE